MSEKHVGNLSAAKWTVEHDAALRAHLADKMTFTEAAAALNRQFGTGYTRNATIGRAGRQGMISMNPPAPRLKDKPKRPRRIPPLTIPKIRRQTPFREPAFRADEVTGLRAADVVPLNLNLVDLGPDQCRWPYGDGPYVFCGHPTLDGSYCHAHQALSVGRGTASERAAA